MCIFEDRKEARDMETIERRYPVGIQTFERLRTGGYVYVDKTDIVWEMTRAAVFVFLSRPRRFGKSLLTTTLESYFQGRKDLFEGLKINEYEKEWVEYPVIRLDLSQAKDMGNATELRRRILMLLKDYAEIYGSEEGEDLPGGMLRGLIKRAYRQTGRQVVVIIDEYDAPLLSVLHDERLDEYRSVMQEMYSILKANEAYIKFCFLTGVTKFSQLSIFSAMNNIMNVTLDRRFSTVCGITEEELETTLWPDVEILAKEYDCTAEEMREMLRDRYDGYHFAGDLRGVYNPFSLFKAFAQMMIGNYWFESGTPSYLIRQMQKYDTDITAMDRLEVPETAFDKPTEAMDDALPLLYQCGYLTIKDYDREGGVYTLSIPNREVRIGYSDNLLPIYVGVKGDTVQTGFALTFWRALKRRDIDCAMESMKTFLAGVPYVEGFKKKLAQAATAEGFYEYTMYLIFSMLNVYCRTQVKCKGGRTDVVVTLADTTWVFELKVNGTGESALAEISKNSLFLRCSSSSKSSFTSVNSGFDESSAWKNQVFSNPRDNGRGYYLPYKAEGRKVVKVGVEFEQETMTVGRWKVEQ